MRTKESQKRYTIHSTAVGKLARYPSMGLAVASVRRILRLSGRPPEDLTIDVEYLVPSGMDRGWYPEASYDVLADGSYERVT